MAKDVQDIILDILRRLELAMDEEKPDFTDIKANAFGISEIRWTRILQMMDEKGLASGIKFTPWAGQTFPGVKFMDLRITLRGIEYLADNTTTAKVIKAAKFLKDVIPGL